MSNIVLPYPDFQPNTKAKSAEIDANFAIIRDTYNADMATIQKYPILGAEAGLVTDATYPYGDVRRYGAVAGGPDASTGFNRALSTGFNVLIDAASYYAHGLLQTVAGQKIIGPGAKIIKNANGTLFASSGDNVEVIGVQFRGDAAAPVFTGDNVTFTGANCSLINCGSRWAAGRAVKATGGHFRIVGTCDIYQTADATATGYDIEIGVSGTANLYSRLEGIYSSQSTGGILAIDVGSLEILGGQFGKLYIKAGTLPAGVNGGKTIGCRILGDVAVEIATAKFVGNDFSSVAITFGAGTSGISMDASNTFTPGHTIINSGNANNLVIRQIAAGGGKYQMKYGDDNSFSILTIDPSSPGQFTAPEFVVPNNKAFRILNSAGTNGAQWSNSAADDVTFANNVTGKAITFTVTGVTSGSRFQFNVGGTIRAVVDNSGLRHGDASAPFSSSGNGSPEGVVTAIVGSFYLRKDGGAGTTFYVKESGAGNTGWVAK